MGKSNQIVKEIFSFIKSEKKYDEEIIKNKFKKFAKEFAIYIDGRNYSAINRMISQDSKLRFNTKISKANNLIARFIDINFKKVFFIEVADVYKTSSNTRVITGFYWAISNNYKLELRKKDISLFINESSGRTIKSNMDGFINLENFSDDFKVEAKDFKIYVSSIDNYYNQKIFKIKTINNSDFRLFFRASVDKARVKLYGKNIYEEKELSLNGEYPRISEFRNDNEFKVISDCKFNNKISMIELSNIYNEKGIGEFDNIDCLIFSDRTLNKKEINKEIEVIKNMIDKLLKVKNLEEFYDITDREIIKQYYKEIIGVDESSFNESESDLLESYRITLADYKFMEIEKIEFEDLFYNLKIKFEFGRKKGLLNIYLKKSNNKFIYSEEYLLMLKEDKIEDISIKGIDCFKKDDIKVAYYPVMGKVLLAIRLNNNKLFSKKYFRIDIYDDENSFSGYLEFPKNMNINSAKCIDDIECEYYSKNLIKDSEFIFTAIDVVNVEKIKRMVISDNSMSMITFKNNIYQINGI